MEKYEEAVFAIKNKEKRRYKPQQVLSKINEKIGVEKTIYWHTLMWKKYEVRPSLDNRTDLCKTEFCEWNSDLTSSYLYYEKWVDFLIENELNI